MSNIATFYKQYYGRARVELRYNTDNGCLKVTIVSHVGEASAILFDNKNGWSKSECIVADDRLFGLYNEEQKSNFYNLARLLNEAPEIESPVEFEVLASFVARMRLVLVDSVARTTDPEKFMEDICCLGFTIDERSRHLLEGELRCDLDIAIDLFRECKKPRFSRIELPEGSDIIAIAYIDPNDSAGNRLHIYHKEDHSIIVYQINRHDICVDIDTVDEVGCAHAKKLHAIFAMMHGTDMMLEGIVED